MNPSYRFERKSFLENLSVENLRHMIALHPAMFSEIYHQRYINNIYFDTPDFKSLHDNLAGVSQRIKYRIRWYGDMFQDIKTPVLELKIKSGLLGYKRSFKLAPFSMNINFDFSDVIQAVKKSDLPLDVYTNFMQLQPALLNRYRRKYYQEKRQLFRVTVDENLNYYQIKKTNNLFLNAHHDRDKLVFELKYNEENDKKASEIMNSFPFRATKSSKYVMGMDFIYNIND